MKNALITGASGGIGKAIAEKLAKKKLNLALVARSESKLKEIASQLSKQYGVEVHVIVADLSKPNSAFDIFEWTQKNNFEPDILINNAGYGLWGNFHELSLSEQFEMMQVNMQSLVALCHLFVPVLAKRRMSQNTITHILNVSSTTAFQAIPTFAVYAATKSFVLSFSRAIRHELKVKGINVTCLVPGATDTGFVSRANLEHIAETAKKFSMTSEAVAEAGLEGMFKRRSEVIPGLLNIVSSQATHFLPKNMIEKMAASIYKIK